MFSVVDSFDFDDEEFANVAQHLELASQEQEPPQKRRSFELGCDSGATPSGLPTKENCNPSPNSPGWGHDVHHTETAQVRKDVPRRETPFQVTQEGRTIITAQLLEVREVNQARQPALRPTHGQLNPACSATVSNSNRPVSAQGSRSSLGLRMGKHSPTGPTSPQLVPASDSALTFADFDFELDLGLDDAASWDPSAKPVTSSAFDLGKYGVGAVVSRNLTPNASVTFTASHAGGATNAPIQPQGATFSQSQPSCGTFNPGQPGSTTSISSQAGDVTSYSGQAGSATFISCEPKNATFTTSQLRDSAFTYGQPGGITYIPGQSGGSTSNSGQLGRPPGILTLAESATDNRTSLRPTVSSLHKAHRNYDPLFQKAPLINRVSQNANLVQYRNLPCDTPQSSTHYTNHNTPQMIMRQHNTMPPNANTETSSKGLSQMSEGGKCLPLRTHAVTTGSDMAQKHDTTPECSITSSGLQLGQSRKSVATKQKRKFPGPAGLLPRLKPGMNLEGMKPSPPATPIISTLQKKPNEPAANPSCSQGGQEVFSDVVWTAMKKDLEPNAQPILKEYSLSAIIRKAGLKQLPRGKVPVLAALIDELNIHVSDASVVLRDPGGGCIKGTVHRQLLKEHGPILCSGAVLVMRQVGVFSPSARNHYLNITPSNIVRLYCRQPGTDAVVCHRLASFAQEDFLPPPSIASADAELPAGISTGQYGAHGGTITSPGVGRSGVYSVVGCSRDSSSSLITPVQSHSLRRPMITRPCTPHSNVVVQRMFSSEQGLPSTAVRLSTVPTCTTRGPKSNTMAGLRPHVTGQKSLATGLTESQHQPPATSSSSTCNTMQDLWEDDQLDQLLTGLDEEMMAEF